MDPAGSDQQVCPSCGLTTPPVEGPTDPYQASSPGCWEAFGRLHLVGASQTAVDTYMAQHPGPATPAGRRSVLIHLVGLHLRLHAQESDPRIRQVLARVFPDKTLDPPELGSLPDLRVITVGDVLRAEPGARPSVERDWAVSVWDAWAVEHHRVVELAERASRPLR
jgi:hypothetical protein